MTLQVRQARADSARMNLKAMMFAGLGLFIAMTATAIWVGNDMAEIKDRARAKRAAECAAQAAAAVPGSAVDPATGTMTGTGAAVDPATGLAMQPAATTTTGAAPTSSTAACPGQAGATTPAQQTTQPGIDPVTGEQLATGAATVPGDQPGAVATDQMFDPTTGQPLDSSASQVAPSDQTSGQTSDDAPGIGTGAPAATETSGF
ncbi:MAG: hypothetical protein JWM86_489 [Thermoleophilia bacterium]|nr:hypothetical protein [Thermoleophilia bacterium]